mmetsp:Transcript_331/g.581  ORF Transcript_331/g.581 Transcript_331/m.581 type:complete len:82 (-) Transcript_331:1201-1446(-)
MSYFMRSGPFVYPCRLYSMFSFIHSFSLSFPPLPLVRRFFVSINNNNNETRCLTRMELERVRATCLPRNSGSMVPSTSPNT